MMPLGVWVGVPAGAVAVGMWLAAGLGGALHLGLLQCFPLSPSNARCV
jgi:hypothetical protein